jgi:uncharacterized membrane protein
MMELRRRSVVKALSRRFIATFITGGIVWAITGQAEIGVKAGIADTLIKLIVYYSHERTWLKIRFGIVKERVPEYKI